jgi:hypothetical protein
VQVVASNKNLWLLHRTEHLFAEISRMAFGQQPPSASNFRLSLVSMVRQAFSRPQGRIRVAAIDLDHALVCRDVPVV